MKNKRNYILICSVLSGILFAFTYELNRLILPVPLYAWSIPAMVIIFDISYLITISGKEKQRTGFIMMIINIILSFTVFLGYNRELVPVIKLFMPVLISVQTLLFTKAGKNAFLKMKFIIDIFYDMVVRGFGHFFDFFKNNRKRGSSPRVRPNGKGFLITLAALAIVFPFAMLALVLLMSADQIFGEFILSLRIGDIFHITGNFIVFIMGFFIFISYLYAHYNYGGYDRYNRYDRTQAENVVFPLIAKLKIPPLFTIVFLFVMNIIYTVFSIIQFLYFFSGKTPEGITLSKYTVSGFSQLIFLTLMNVILLITAMILTDKENYRKAVSLRSMNILLIINNFVMLISAFLRLSKYEAAYGFTKIRFYGYVLLAAIAVVLIYAFFKILVNKLPLRAFVCWTGIGFLICLMFINTGEFISNNNVQRYLKDPQKDIDISYIEKLGPGAVKPLKELIDKAEDSAVISRAETAINKIEEGIENNGKYKSINDLIAQEELKKNWRQ